MSNFRIRVARLMMGESSGYNSQYRRPYQTTVNGTTLGMVQERMDAAMGDARRVNGGLFAGIAMDVVAPQAGVEMDRNNNPIIIDIPHGWNTKRFYFLLEVEIMNELGGYVTEIIQGYTDHNDHVSFNNTIDPNTPFFINSITRLGNSMEHAYGAAIETKRVLESNHVVANHAWNGIESLNTPASFTSMRPGDVYASITANQMMGEATYFDGRTQHTTQPKASRRSNNVPTSYAAGLLGSYMTAVAKDLYHGDGPGVYTSAMGETLEKPLTKNAFINAISQTRNTPISDNFTYADLLRLDPTADQRTVAFVSGAASGTGNWGVGSFGQQDSQHWLGTNVETRAATVISGSVPGMLIEAGISSIDLLATNHDHSGAQVIVHNADGFSKGQDLRGPINAFRSRLLAEIMNQLSYNDGIAYNIRIQADIYSNTTVWIQFENNPEVMYSSPTFADALIAPVLTHDRGRLDEVANDFNNLMSEVVRSPAQALELEDIQYSGHQYSGGSTAVAHHDI